MGVEEIEPDPSPHINSQRVASQNEKAQGIPTRSWFHHLEEN